MIELLFGMDLQLGGDVHVLRAGEHLRIDDVRDDRLIFAGEIFVQQLGEAVASNFVFVGVGIRTRALAISFINQNEVRLL